MHSVTVVSECVTSQAAPLLNGVKPVKAVEASVSILVDTDSFLSCILALFVSQCVRVCVRVSVMDLL